MDGMSAIAVVPPQETYKDFADAILSYQKRKDVTCPKGLTIIFDLYSSTSTSNQLRSKEVSQTVEFIFQV